MDLISCLKDDHESIHKLISNLDRQDDVKLKRQTFVELLIVVRMHMRAEESAVYAKCLKVKNAETNEMAIEGYDDHRLLEDYVYKIKASPSDEVWVSRVNTYCQILQLHIAVEETDFFPEIKERLSDFELQQSAILYLQAKKTQELELRSAEAFGYSKRFFMN